MAELALITGLSFGTDVLIGPLIGNPVWKHAHQYLEQAGGIVAGSVCATIGWSATQALVFHHWDGFELASILGAVAVAQLVGGRYLYWDLWNRFEKFRPYIGPSMTAFGAAVGYILYQLLRS